MIGYLVLAIIALSLVSYFLGRRRSLAMVGGRQQELHSRPNYHGAYIAAWVGIPSFLLVLIWIALQGQVIDRLLEGSLPGSLTQGLDQDQIGLLLSEIKLGRRRQCFRRADPAVQEAAERYRHWQAIARYAMVAAALSLALLGPSSRAAALALSSGRGMGWSGYSTG
jgi:phosphate transport system permease protein